MPMPFEESFFTVISAIALGDDDYSGGPVEVADGGDSNGNDDDGLAFRSMLKMVVEVME